MARVKEDIAGISRKLIEEARAGVFKPVYILMGDEPYYPDLVCQAIIDNCVDEFGKDFNETICYGADVTAEQVVTAARRFPMMADRQLVVVKEAQMMKSLEEIAVYCNEPLDSTVLVLLLHKATVDKRKALYKGAQKIGVVLDSPALRDYEVPGWVSGYYRERGLQIEPEAASLLAESVGTDLSMYPTRAKRTREPLLPLCVAIWRSTLRRSSLSLEMRCFTIRRSTSIWVSPIPPRVPMPPRWRSR